MKTDLYGVKSTSLRVKTGVWRETAAGQREKRKVRREKQAVWREKGGMPRENVHRVPRGPVVGVKTELYGVKSTGLRVKREVWRETASGPREKRKVRREKGGMPRENVHRAPAGRGVGVKTDLYGVKSTSLRVKTGVWRETASG
ncbi:hypothetical protein [Bacillus marinisedimentorum]|uniref:hypothetical protein n=1 Tax=Bacillus marinisedimentorum TaxID=1821260 RepID=UPI0012FFC489|nr:hypothetical protein [Bacillus marinisedimentorum]